MTKILDCTIRDGGHVNNWNFSDDCVKESYYAAAKSGVDFFEIGYRCDNPKSEWGKYANCEDDFLKNLLTPDDKCEISIMIDAGKCSLERFVECKPENTPIKLVRVATYPDMLPVAFSLCEGLKNKGYKVILNLMAISEYSETDYIKIASWECKNCPEAVCFADSFGTFIPEDVSKYYSKLKTLGFSNICFHSHNNLQLAFANSLEALKKDFYCIDCSIYGMGREAGNLPAELITGYLNKTNKNKYNPVPYIDVIKKYYLALSQNKHWGYSVQSLIGGLKNIHPYYIESLFEQNDCSVTEIWKTSDVIKEKASISYSKEDLDKILKLKE